MLERQIGRYVAQPGLAHDQQLLVGIGGVGAHRTQVTLLVPGRVPGAGRRRLAREGALGGAAGALPVAHREVRGVVYEKHGSTEPASGTLGLIVRWDLARYSTHTNSGCVPLVKTA